MSFELMIARRYLRAKRRINLITIISAISVLGITIGVGVLISVLSVFNGFNTIVKDLLIGFDPHLRITPVEETTFTPDSILTMVASHPHVVAAAPFISGRSAIIHEDGLRVVEIRGLRPEDIHTAIGLGDNIVAGTFTGNNGEPEDPLVLGTLLNYSLRTATRDTIALLSQAGLEQSLTQMAQPKIIKSVITGLFETNNKDYDSRYAYTTLETARKVFAVPEGQAMGVEIRVDDLELAPQIQKELAASLGNHFRVETWQDLHRDLFGVMELERWAAFTILLLIIIVAVFNVLGSLTMTVIEKQRDIGILKTMGASDRSITRIFIFEGALIGIIGTVAGLTLGLLFCWLQSEFGLLELDRSNYIIPAMPVVVKATDVLLVCAVSLLLAVVAAIYPARRAAHMLPADAVRWE